MIQIKIMSPLPDILRLTTSSNTLKVELPYSDGLTLYAAMEQLARDYPKFSARLEQEGTSAVLDPLLFSIDGKIYDRAGRESTPLHDNCQLLVFMPYAGG